MTKADVDLFYDQDLESYFLMLTAAVIVQLAEDAVKSGKIPSD